MTARHLRLFDPAQAAQPLTAKSAREAVVALGQRYALELMDALAALAAAHDSPAGAVRDLQDLRPNTIGVTGYTFDVAVQCANRTRLAK